MFFHAPPAFFPTRPKVVIFLAQGTTTWTVPSDWSPNNTIECIGAGAGGQQGLAAPNAGAGGGGGAYSKIAALSLIPGAIVTVQVGLGGAGGNPGQNGTDTWFNGASLGAASVGAKGGSAPSGSTGGAGGPAAAGVGSTRYSGGDGGSAPTTRGGGGGGAAGPVGAGGNGAPTGAGGAAAGGASGGAALGEDGAQGGAGTEFDPTHGSGGGGGGAGP